MENEAKRIIKRNEMRYINILKWQNVEEIKDKNNKITSEIKKYKCKEKVNIKIIINEN